MYNPKATEVVLNNVRLSYVHIMKPYAKDPAMEPKYSATILLPKTDTAGKAKIDAAIAAAKQQGATDKWGGVVPPIIPDPIHDGDGVKQDGTAFGPECKGMWVFTASSSQDSPIEVVDRMNNKILDSTQVYSGIIANVFVRFFPYAYQGKKGIGCGLGPVQKVADGERLSGGAPSAASVFGAMGSPAPAAAPSINPITGLPF